jgi:hypothetical protein
MPLRRLVVLLVMLLPAVAGARSPVDRTRSYTFSVAARGTLLDLTFDNPTTRELDVPVRVRADDIHHDPLTVTLVRDDEVRDVRFVRAREKAAPEHVTLAPGARHVETIDLAAWAGPLGPGAYQVIARWDAAPVHVVASTLMSVPYPRRCGLVDAHARAQAATNASAAPAAPAPPRDRAAVWSDAASWPRTGLLLAALLSALLVGLLVGLLGAGRLVRRAGAVGVGMPHSTP